MSKREDDFLTKVNSLFQREGLSGSLVVFTSSDTEEKQHLGDANSTVFLSKRENVSTVEDISGIAITDYWEELPEILADMINQKSAPIVYLRVGLDEQEKIQDLLFSKGYIGQKTHVRKNEVASFYHRSRSHKKFFDTEGYWEKRYSEGGKSGSGSRGRLAQFKADFLSEFVDTLGVKSVIEFGCGDGYVAAMASFPKYLGLDISQSAIDTCNQRFAGDKTKKFDVYDSESFPEKGNKAELTLSLDVIFHLSNDSDYESHLRDLFKSAEKYVIIYSNSTSFDRAGFDSSQNYMKFRNFIKDCKQFDEWSLVGTLSNLYPFSVRNPSNTSVSDFFIFNKGGQEAAVIQNLIEQPSENPIKVMHQLRVMDENSFETQALLKKLGNDVATINSHLANDKKETIQAIRETEWRAAQVSTEATLNDLSQRLVASEQKLAESNTERKRLEERNLELEKRIQKVTTLYYQLLKSRWTRLGFNLFWMMSKLKLTFFGRQLSVFTRKMGNTIKAVLNRFNLRKLGQRKEKNSENDVVPTSWSPPSKEAWELSVKGWNIESYDRKPRALTVLDEFSESSFRGSVNIFNPRPDNWFGLAMKSKPEFILVESAWKGNGGSWEHRVGSYEFAPGRELKEMLDWARSESIPTVFWNKEDPVHFKRFIETAKMFDFVYTTDEKMVETYKRETKAKSVKSLMFAANPRIHRPLALSWRNSRIGFAGSWYGSRYPKRAEEMEEILSASLEFDLDIFDRNFGTGRYPFPEKFKSYVRGSRSYEEICIEYRKYRVFLNGNSVHDSPTMFSRRVFELLASGTPVISTDSIGMREVFGETITVHKGNSQTSAALERLMRDDKHWRDVSLSGIREVLSNHTYEDRVQQILADIGVRRTLTGPPKVLIVGKFNHENQIKDLEKQLAEQSYRNFDFVAVIGSTVNLIIGKSGGNFDFLLDQQDISRQNFSEYDLIAIVGFQNKYGKHYLQDLINARKLEPEANVWSVTKDAEISFQTLDNFNLEASLMSKDAFIKEWLKYVNQKQIERSSTPSFFIDSNQFNEK